jgi:uncharacterized protein
MKTSDTLLSLELQPWAMAGGATTQSTPLATLSRVAQACLAPAERQAPKCEWQLQSQLRHPDTLEQLWLHLKASLSVEQTCQRCLLPIRVDLLVDRHFRFVADEATALAEDDDCEEDLLSPAPELTLQTLLEDELLLAMPLIPRHATCDKPLQQSPDQDLPHPFAALAGLKLGKQ